MKILASMQEKIAASRQLNCWLQLVSALIAPIVTSEPGQFKDASVVK